MSTLLDLELNELPGATVFADSSGYVNDATIAGAAGGVSAGNPGHSGNAVKFTGPGTAGVLKVVDPTGIPDAAQIWVEAWIKPDLVNLPAQTVAIRAGAATSIAYVLRLVNNNVQFQVLGTASASPCTVVTSDNQLAVNGNWYHVAGWYDGLSASVAINGMRVSAVCGSAPNLGSGPIVAGGPFYVGGILNNGNAVIEPFAGLIDEVRVRPVAAQPYVPGGRVSCPTGFTLIGTPGSRMAFCISESNQTPTNFNGSYAGCYAKSPERAELCSTQQWMMACAAGMPNPVAAGYEFTADSAYAGNVGCFQGCNYADSCGPNGTYSYRCCLR